MLIDKNIRKVVYYFFILYLSLFGNKEAFYNFHVKHIICETMNRHIFKPPPSEYDNYIEYRPSNSTDLLHTIYVNTDIGVESDAVVAYNDISFKTSEITQNLSNFNKKTTSQRYAFSLQRPLSQDASLKLLQFSKPFSFILESETTEKHYDSSFNALRAWYRLRHKYLLEHENKEISDYVMGSSGQCIYGSIDAMLMMSHDFLSVCIDSVKYYNWHNIKNLNNYSVEPYVSSQEVTNCIKKIRDFDCIANNMQVACIIRRLYVRAIRVANHATILCTKKLNTPGPLLAEFTALQQARINILNDINTVHKGAIEINDSKVIQVSISDFCESQMLNAYNFGLVEFLNQNPQGVMFYGKNTISKCITQDNNKLVSDKSVDILTAYLKYMIAEDIVGYKKQIIKTWILLDDIRDCLKFHEVSTKVVF